jgi:hypothetical protein
MMFRHPYIIGGDKRAASYPASSSNNLTSGAIDSGCSFGP